MQLEEEIIGLFAETPRLTFKAVECAVRHLRPIVARNEIRSAVKTLLEKGLLRYSHRFGFSELERNYARPHRVAPRIWLGPAETDTAVASGEVMVLLASGASFGCGDHPTTRLALQGVDMAVERLNSRQSILDIGTGTGVLALAALALGMESAVALDIDPLACHETMANARLNGMEKRMIATERTLEDLGEQRFNLLTANLRPPTLKVLFQAMHQHTAENGFWVLSGFRCEEMPDLRPYTEGGGRVIRWTAKEGGWGAWLVSCPLLA